MRELAGLFLLGVFWALSGCQSLPPQPLETKARFLLTFDDGPSVATGFNPTLAILEQLQTNDIQPGIKAIFFVQTRNRNGGGVPLGKDIMRLTHQQGHILGLHSATPAGHVGHVSMTPWELDDSLRNGKDDIRAITGDNPLFVRPPHWRFNPQTHALYSNNELHMVLTDVKWRDGIIHVFDENPFGPNYIHYDLRNVRRAIERGELPVVDGYVPVVVTFHDVNAFTARHLTEYLRVLVQAAAAVGLALDAAPFYGQTQALSAAAKQRALPQLQRQPLLTVKKATPAKGTEEAPHYYE